MNLDQSIDLELINITSEEIWPLLNILNEATNGFYIHEFSKIIGADKNFVLELMDKIACQDGKESPILSLNSQELHVINNAFREVLKQIEECEFQTRVGISINEALNIKNKISPSKVKGSRSKNIGFFIEKPQEEQNFSLVYRPDDYSFDVEPLDGSGDTSIMINDLQLEINYEGKIIYVWGYCPLLKYEEIDEFPQKYEAKSLVAILDKPPVPGISYRLNEDARWPIYINKKKGWVCLGNPNTKGKQLIEFAPDCVATMEGQELIAVWLHPKELPDFNKHFSRQDK